MTAAFRALLKTNDSNNSTASQTAPIPFLIGNIAAAHDGLASLFSTGLDKSVNYYYRQIIADPNLQTNPVDLNSLVYQKKLQPPTDSDNPDLVEVTNRIKAGDESSIKNFIAFRLISQYQKT